jgi:hypothetical protein
MIASQLNLEDVHDAVFVSELNSYRKVCEVFMVRCIKGIMATLERFHLCLKTSRPSSDARGILKLNI